MNMSNIDYKQFADDIVDLVGGVENIRGLEHCVTRLRFDLVDLDKANTEEIKKHKPVLGVVSTGKQYQVVVGQEVVPCFNAIVEKYSFNGEKVESKDKPKEKLTFKSLWGNLIDYISGTMAQIIPLFIGCGFISCILSVARIATTVDTSGSTYLLLNAIANSPFYFLPVLVGFAASKKLKCNPFLGAMLGLILLHPSFTKMVGAEMETTLFGLKFSALSYASSFFPTLIGAWVLSKVEKFVYGLMPKVLKSIFGPFLTILIMSLLMVYIIGPIGYYIGQGLAKAVLSLTNLPFGLGCGVLSALQPILVVFGAHTVLAAPMTQNITDLGYDPIIRPAFIMASFAGFGAVLAVAVKAKDKDLKSIAFGSSITSFLGTNEPGIYGVLLPLFKPFVCSLGGAFVGGVVSSLLGAKAFAMGKNGVFGWLVFNETLPQIIIASIVATAVAFILVWIVGFDESKVTN